MSLLLLPGSRAWRSVLLSLMALGLIATDPVESTAETNPPKQSGQYPKPDPYQQYGKTQENVLAGVPGPTAVVSTDDRQSHVALWRSAHSDQTLDSFPVLRTEITVPECSHISEQHVWRHAWFCLTEEHLVENQTHLVMMDVMKCEMGSLRIAVTNIAIAAQSRPIDSCDPRSMKERLATHANPSIEQRFEVTWATLQPWWTNTFAVLLTIAGSCLACTYRRRHRPLSLIHISGPRDS